MRKTGKFVLRLAWNLFPKGTLLLQCQFDGFTALPRLTQQLWGVAWHGAFS
jgi:glutathionylspermidine synthase